MAFIKCIECGKIYDTNLEACPQCGCPTEQQLQQPVFNSDDNVPVDATSIFEINEDKFEETKDIRIATKGRLSTSIDDLCKSLQSQPPQVYLTYHMEKGVGQLLVCYDERDFLKKINSIHNNALANKYSCACRRLIINIDDKENIRLNLDNNESKWKSDFPISQEMFLKCCRAKKLEFKISKENEESILVNGYYGFDPESGAEVDANGIIVPENELILNFQALYNYVIDPNMFNDALQKRQMLDVWNKKQAGLSAQGKQKDASKNEKHGVNLTKNPRAVIILIVVLGILFISLVILDEMSSSSTKADTSTPTVNTRTETSTPTVTTKNEPSTSKEIETYRRFVGTYTFYESKYDERYGVLSDGRVVHNVGNGKEYVGEIVLLSDDAFMIHFTKRFSYSVGPVDAYVQRNGREVNVWRSTPYLDNFVFEISTNRAYEEYKDYRNRDIAEAPYLKFKHSSSLF